MKISVLAIDLAKNVFQLHGNDAAGKCVLRRKLRRSELFAFLSNLPPCIVAMESCGGAQYWGRKFREIGHDVRLIAPQFVKPFVRTNKNDAADAEAIAEASVRPNMRFVPLKEASQQEHLALHRVRSLLLGQRVKTSNAIRGLLGEHGFVFPKGDSSLLKALTEILSQPESPFGDLFTESLRDLWSHLKQLQKQIRAIDERIEKLAKEDDRCRRIQKISGVGPLTATAIVAHVGNAKNFKNGRQLAAFLGLVPKQCSSGGKVQLLGISKRGDGYLRRLLIHGARASIQFAGRRTDYRSRWVSEKVKSRGINKATVALANHNARVIWALLAKEQEYRMSA